MKTSTLTKLFLLPVAASFFLQACGSGSSDKQLRGRLNFDVTDVSFVYPTDQSTNVPINVTFRMQFPGDSTICESPEAVNQVIGIKRADSTYDDLNYSSDVQVRLAEGYKPESVQPADGSICEIWARIDRSVNSEFLQKNTRYIGGIIDNTNGERFKKKSVEFVTGTEPVYFQFNSILNQPDLWSKLTDFDPAQGFTNINGENFDWTQAMSDYLAFSGNAILTYLLNATFGFGQPPYYTTKMQFSEALDPEDFRNYIKLVKLMTVEEFTNRDFDFQSLHIFNDSDLSGCGNPYDPSDYRYASFPSWGPCMYFSSTDRSNKTVTVKGPDNGCLNPNTLYAVIISKSLLSAVGSQLPVSYVQYFVTNGNSCQ